MQFALDSSDLDPTCLLVSAWLVVAFLLCAWYLLITRHTSH